MGGYSYDPERAICTHLIDGKCSVSEKRPFICRLYGASELMTDGTTSAAGAANITVSLANSKGLTLSHSAGMRYTYAEAIVNDGNEPSFGTAIAHTLQTDRGIAKQATEQALARLGATGVKSGTYDVIFNA